MNTSQLNCFLKAAEVLNFTKAAESLYMTQPVLSRQIAALENELDMQLFIRERSTVKLTPAGKVLAEGLDRVKGDFERVLDEARQVNQGASGTLKVGTAEGQMIGGYFESVFFHMWREYPEVNIQVSYFPIAGLTHALDRGEIDIAIMAKVEADKLNDLVTMETRKEMAYLAIPASHHSATKTEHSIMAFKDDTFIVVSSDESSEIQQRQFKVFERNGIKPRIKIAPSVGTLAFWVEQGLGVASINGWHVIRNSPKVKFVRVEGLGMVEEVVAWKSDNKNQSIELFTKLLTIAKETGYDKPLSGE